MLRQYCLNKEKKVMLTTTFCDPRLSRTEEIVGKNRLKFLDLNASIYGNFLHLKMAFFII